MSAVIEAIDSYRKKMEGLAQDAYDATLEKGKEGILNGLRLILSQYDLHNHKITIDGYSPCLYINGKPWDKALNHSSEHSLLRERSFPKSSDSERPSIGKVLVEMGNMIESNFNYDWYCLIAEKLN